MIQQKRRVFLTGATGLMGSAGLEELIKYPDRYDIFILARPSKKNKKKLSAYVKKGVKVIWGDLLDAESIKEGVKNADIILHVGGMVSPLADHYPERTISVNVGSMKLIAEEVKKIESEDSSRIISVVYIGSVSQYGPKLPPDHWGEVGDMLRAARFDAYALSKILAERVLLEAGLKRWVSLRQTGILHSGLLKKAGDPITFHVPLNGILEWVSVEDSGRLLEKVCREEVPDSFWNQFYNIGGGEKFRLINYEFETHILKALGCPPPEKIFEPNWFATDNFHGVWFRDSDDLENILHFRHDASFEDTLTRIRSQLPFYFKLTPLAPAFLIKKIMKRVASKPGLGTLTWIRENNSERIDAHWGGTGEYEKIKGWESFSPSLLERRSEKKKESPGKTCSNNLYKTKCRHGHEYLTSEMLEYGGHRCPYCLKADIRF